MDSLTLSAALIIAVIALGLGITFFLYSKKNSSPEAFISSELTGARQKLAQNEQDLRMLSNRAAALENEIKNRQVLNANLNVQLQTALADLKRERELSRSLQNQYADLKGRWHSLQENAEDLKQRLEESKQHQLQLNRQIDQFRHSSAEAGKKQAGMESELNAKNSRINELGHNLKLNEAKQAELLHQVRELTNEKNDLVKEKTRLLSLNDELKHLREADQKRFEESSAKLEQSLSVLGERMLRERGEQLSVKSREELDKTVQPLRNELNTLRQLLLESQKISTEQSGALSNELTKLQNAQKTLSAQAEDLAHALRSGGKSQGMWGELQLERALDASGLTRGIEYEREVAGVRALGENGRPDAIIRLPENHCLIIDAKCSLTAYTEAVNAVNESDKNTALRAHVASLRRHIDGLSARKYESYESLNSPDFVFMFVPIDSALTAACLNDGGLYEYAQKKRVYLVSPSTLVPALRVVSTLWMLSTQNDRIRKLALDANKIYDKFLLVCESFDDVIKREQQLASSISQLGTRLNTGKGNLRTQLQNFSQGAPQVVQDLNPHLIDAEKDLTPKLIQPGEPANRD